MIVLSGASASGKTEVAKLLATKYGISKITTTTTRDMRVNEVNGRDYFFVTPERFMEMIEEDKFVEYTNFNGKWYGSTKDQIGPNKCIVVDPIGLVAYLKLHDDEILTFFLDSKEDIRLKRMLARGDKPEDAHNRILHDRIAFNKRYVKNVDYHINSEEDRSVEQVAEEVFQIYSKFIIDKKK